MFSEIPDLLLCLFLGTFLDTREAASLLRRSPAAIRNMVLRQVIPYRKAGGRLLFIEEELVAWVRQSPGVSVDDLKQEGRPGRDGQR